MQYIDIKTYIDRRIESGIETIELEEIN